ncbi:MAG: glycosyl transferase [Lachnospiraceae bacterium]|nr:glycosyl transferase [Lachnospiraceae bacterium]
MGNKLKILYTMVTDSDKRFIIMRNKGWLNKMDDRKYLERLWKCFMGYEIDIDNPVTFNEKLQWLKLNDRNPLYHKLADKIEVKKWVADKIGEQYIIPTLQVWNEPGEIDFDNLSDRFVLKCNHNSGVGMYICTDKLNVNAEMVRQGLAEGLAQDYYLPYREWAYKDIPRKILAEEYISTETSNDMSSSYGLIDYKVHCFNGTPLFIEVIGDRDHSAGTAKADLYDFDWNRLDWGFGDYPSFGKILPKPDNLQELYDVTSKLSEQMRYVRVDFYIIDRDLKFGEMTFYPNGGMVFYNNVYTHERDKLLGENIIL